MSVLDEVMPADEPHQQTTTVFVDAVQTFVPRTVLKPVLGNLVVGLVTTPDATKTHYTVGDGTFAYHMFFAQAGMPLVDVIAMAYRNVFMWIRPQGANGVYYDPYHDRIAAMANIMHTLSELVGSGTVSDRLYAEYRDERKLEINKGEEAFVIDIRRTYNRTTDQITTTIMSLPERYGNLSVDEIFEEGITTTVQRSPAFVDPGDFMPGVWTPDPNADIGGETL